MDSANYRRGMKSEHYVLEILRSGKVEIEELGKVKDIIVYDDYGNKEHKQKQIDGIDCEIINADGKKISVDIKQDKWLLKSKNVLAEMVIDENGWRKDGWFGYGKSDYILWDCVGADGRPLVVMDLNKFRALAKDLIWAAEYKVRRIKTAPGKYTTNYLFEYDKVKECCKIYTHQ